MISAIVRDGIDKIVAGGLAGIATAFVQESIEHMIPWLIVSAAVIICDLACGLRKSIIMGEQVRFSRAVRRTMGKMVTYFSFVFMVVMINKASGSRYDIDMYSCLMVCFLEMCSIISNILKPKGIELNIVEAFRLIFGKTLKVDKEDIKEVIKEEKK